MFVFVTTSALLLLRRRNARSSINGSNAPNVLDVSSDSARAALVDQAARREEILLRSKRRSVVVYLIRHAQSETNKTKNHCHNGRHIHVPLSELGQKQARALGKRLAKLWIVKDTAAKCIFPERMFASEALRAQQTAHFVREEVIGYLAAADVNCIETLPAVEVVTTRHQFSSSDGNSSADTAAMGICEIAMGGWTGMPKVDCNTQAALAARETDAWEWR